MYVLACMLAHMLRHAREGGDPIPPSENEK